LKQYREERERERKEREEREREREEKLERHLEDTKRLLAEYAIVPCSSPIISPLSVDAIQEQLLTTVENVHLTDSFPGFRQAPPSDVGFTDDPPAGHEDSAIHGFFQTQLRLIINPRTVQSLLVHTYKARNLGGRSPDFSIAVTQYADVHFLHNIQAVAELKKPNPGFPCESDLGQILDYLQLILLRCPNRQAESSPLRFRLEFPYPRSRPSTLTSPSLSLARKALSVAYCGAMPIPNRTSVLQ